MAFSSFPPWSGMGRELLESVNISPPESEDKEKYNVVLMEKLLRILYGSCQYGES